MKKILFVNGSFNEIPLIKAAHKLNYYVITSGNDPLGEGHKYANRYIACDYSDKEAILSIAKQENVDAICACGNDFGALSAAYACEKLGLPGHDKYETGRLFHEKDQFKKMAVELGLNTPKAQAFSDINEAYKYVKTVSFPQIIKPVDLGGGKGIGIANSYDEAMAAIKLAFDKSKVKHIVIEDYIEGKQQGITVYLKNQKVVFDYSTDDFSLLNPFMVWVAYGSPAYNYDLYRNQIIDDIEKIAREKCVSDGFLTIQYILKGTTPYYLETMRRCLGNCHYMCMSRDTGVDFYEWFVASECGMDCTEYYSAVVHANHKSGFMGLYASGNGVIKDYKVDEKFQNMIFDSVMLNGPGYKVDDYLHDKLGMLFYTLKNEEDEEWFVRNMRNVVTVSLAEGKNENNY